MFTDQVFVFSPKGDVYSFPSGATPVDFAFSIHSAVGYKMQGARVNGKIVNLDHQMQNGDIVEIITSSAVHGPSRDWLKIVKTAQARNKINAWYKKENRAENIIKGKEMLEKEIKRDNYTYIPSSENKIAVEKQKENVQKYIPSQNSKVPAKTFDNSGLEAALRRADKAEQTAIEILSGNFGN